MLYTREKKVYYILRFATAMCFIGHGAFGIITKPIWCNYFAVFGISHDLAYRLMPFVGSVDILMGVLIVIYPVRAIFCWLVLWGTVTALLRPISGEPFAEFIERAGNYAAPLSSLLLCGGIRKNMKGLLSPMTISCIQQDERTRIRVITCLRIAAFLLLAGHGWLNLIDKKGLIDQYTALGFHNGGKIAMIIGILEVVTSFAVLIRPLRPLLLFLFIWKVTSELFYPHYELFEWIERGGSYGALLAWWVASDETGFPAIKINLNRKYKLQLGKTQQ